MNFSIEIKLFIINQSSLQLIIKELLIGSLSLQIVTLKTGTFRCSVGIFQPSGREFRETADNGVVRRRNSDQGPMGGPMGGSVGGSVGVRGPLIWP